MSFKKGDRVRYFKQGSTVAREGAIAYVRRDHDGGEYVDIEWEAEHPRSWNAEHTKIQGNGSYWPDHFRVDNTLREGDPGFVSSEELAEVMKSLGVEP